MTDHFVVLAAESSIRFIGVCNDINCLSALSGAKFFGLMAYGSLADTFCRFDQKTPQMRIPRFGDTEPVYVCGT